MPLEQVVEHYDVHENLKDSMVNSLRGKARTRGLSGFQLPRKRSGMGALAVVGMAVLYEEAAHFPFVWLLAFIENCMSFGSTLAEHEGVQWMLGAVAKDIQVGRLLTMHAAWELDRGSRPPAESG